MTLVVDFQDFAASVKRFGKGQDDCVFYKRAGDSIHLTYVNPDKGIQIVSFRQGTEQAAKEEIEGHGFCASKGVWVTEASLEHLAQLTSETYIAAVSYDTKRGPGLWVDAYPAPPSEGSVLRAIFEEFVSEGLIDERAFEQFIQEAKPLVRILEPADVDRFIKQKE